MIQSKVQLLQRDIEPVVSNLRETYYGTQAHTVVRSVHRLRAMPVIPRMV